MGKDKKGKPPKRIGGVKLPKALRKQAKAALAELGQPVMRDLASAALGVAAAAIARQAEKMRAEAAARTAPQPASEASGGNEARPATPAAPGGAQLAELATGLAVAALGRWMEKAAPKPAAPGAAGE